MTPSNPLADVTTLRDIAPRVGSYFTAYSLSTSGAFGDPVGVVGRTKLFPSAVVESAIASYLAKRALRAARAR